MMREQILEEYTIGNGVCTTAATDKPDGSWDLCLTFSGGCDPGDYVEVNIRETEDGTGSPKTGQITLDGLTVDEDWATEWLDRIIAWKRAVEEANDERD